MSLTPEQVLQAFRTASGLPVKRVTRTGHERVAMRYTFDLDGGAELRVDDKTLWSRVEFRREAVTRLRVRPAVVAGESQKDLNAIWTHAVEALLMHVVRDAATPGERFTEVVRDWLVAYSAGATSDRDGAAATGAPFIEGGILFVKAERLAVYIRREQVEPVNRTDLYQALRDLGFARVAIHYSRGRGEAVTRSTTSYYSAPVDALELPREDAA